MSLLAIAVSVLAPRLLCSARNGMAAPNRIAFHRKAKGLSQPELAEKVGAHAITISRLERGVMALTEDWMKRLGDALGVLPADLLPKDALIGNAAVHGEISQDGTVAVRPPGQVELLRVTTGFFSNPNSFWLESKTTAFEPFFGPGSFLKCEWLTESEYERAYGRLCFAELRPAAGRVGFLNAAEKTVKSFKGLTVNYSLGVPGHETVEIEPRNLALVTAIVLPSIDISA